MQQFSNQVARVNPKRLKVLLVDDDETIHETLELFLENTNFSLISAMNVKAAISRVISDKPDIIITDAMMPGESGYSLIYKLKSQPETSGIPIILWTSLENPDGGVRDASQQADFSISKPFYNAEIMASLEQAKELIETDQNNGNCAP